MLRTYKDDKDYYTSLPRKRIGAGVLLFYKSQLLIMQPIYNNAWLLPGGTVEAEESPLEGLHREIKESLNLTIEPTRMIAVDYIHNRDVKGEYIQFLFEARELSEADVMKIKVNHADFKDFKFVDLEQAVTMLTPGAARRLESAMVSIQDGQQMLYLEDGNVPPFKAEMAFL